MKYVGLLLAYLIILGQAVGFRYLWRNLQSAKDGSNRMEGVEE